MSVKTLDRIHFTEKGPIKQHFFYHLLQLKCQMFEQILPQER